MSGHSKWATIHRQKEAKDARRGTVFTKLGRAITIAVGEGGGVGDIQKNFRLRLAVEKARQANMPKDNIQRAIDRGMGAEGGEGLAEVVYEGFLPGGAAVIIQVHTDNKLRTLQQVREVLDRGGGTLAGQGAVGYLFSPAGEIKIKLQESKTPGLKTKEERELEIIDLGVEDIEELTDGWLVYTDREKLIETKDELERLGYTVESVELVMRPQTPQVYADPRQQKKVEELLDRLEELDDVHKVWTNYLPQSYA